MKQILVLEQLPPSVNLAYFFVKMKMGRIIKVKTKRAKDFVAYSIEEATKQKMTLTDKKIKVTITYCFSDKRKHDIDNVNKIMIDSLQGIMYTDDNNIIELHCYKLYGSKASVTVEQEIIDEQEEIKTDYMRGDL